MALAAVGAGIWWSLAHRNAATPSQNVAGVSTEGEQPQSLTVNHYYNNGQHSIEGTITLPTPCHSLEQNVSVTRGTPDKVVIAFTTRAGAGVCTQVLSDKFFRVVFAAGPDAQVSATLNGQPLSLVYSENKEGITK